MSDRMTPIAFGDLMDWILSEYESYGTIFGVSKIYRAAEGKTLELFGEKLETPIGPAAGPHTQLAQNIIAAYAAGSRFFELKTVQILDGEDLPVSKPCITAADECYNCEWSTELTVGQAMAEYIKAWFALKLISKEFGLGSDDGFIFNMSVGYDLEGIKSEKIDSFIEGLKNAEPTTAFVECRSWALNNIHRFGNIDIYYVNRISPRISRSITLSTLHGCPPQEIERIATYLITEKNLNTFVKCNPTLLGYDFAKSTLDSLGYDYLIFDDFHFNDDLQYEDAVPMFHRLQDLAGSKELLFGVKLTNTFPVTPGDNELPAGEMYMSGRSLFPLTIALANKLSHDFDGKLRISYSGGADAYSVKSLYDAGIWPITKATTLLKPGGYNRFRQIADVFEDCEYSPFDKVNVKKCEALASSALEDAHYKKSIKPEKVKKMDKSVPLTDCFVAPCRYGCPINQDIPAYIRLAGKGKYLEALRVITERNPLPFITGSICPHPCMGRCNRLFYDGAVNIRGVKLESVQNAYEELIRELKPAEAIEKNIAIVGGGPAGLAAAFFLARSGCKVTVYEKTDSLGGIVRQVIPSFRASEEIIDGDVNLCRALGVEFVLGHEVSSIEELKSQGFDAVVLCVGAPKSGELQLHYGESINAVEFLKAFKQTPESIDLGRNVVIVGGGNTAMDAARAAKRVSGVERVSLLYRRTKRQMPADEEELRFALDEGVEIYELLSPVGIKDGVLECIKMSLDSPDSDGRRSVVKTANRARLSADTIIAAVGEQIDTEFLKLMGLATDGKGRAIVNPLTYETSIPSVYISGDGRNGPATVVQAIADGAKVASAICGADFNRYMEINKASTDESARSKKGLLDTKCHCSESTKCLECDTVCENCVDVCPNRANLSILVQGRPQILHIEGMCNHCGNCETFCPYNSAPYKHKFTLFWSEDELMDSENQGFFYEAGGVKVRLAAEVLDLSLENMSEELSSDMEDFIDTVIHNYPHLLCK